MKLKFSPDIYTKSLKQHLNDLEFKKSNLKKFRNYIDFSNKIFSYEFSDFTIPDETFRLNAINKLIRILSLDVQNSILNHVLNEEYDFNFDPILDNNQLHCPKCFEIKHYDLKLSELINPIPFDISKHPTISLPWKIDRLIGTLGSIGDFVENPFSFDHNNHFGSILIFPINLLIIGNGFHSSTSGIYDTNAIYYPEYTLDISDWYNEIIFDGTFFRHKKCNSILESPENKSIGIIYEIGRILVNHNLSLSSLHFKNK